MTDLSSQVPSDGVAKEQAVSALSTVEEVEQGALESFSKFTQTRVPPGCDHGCEKSSRTNLSPMFGATASLRSATLLRKVTDV